MKIKPKKSLGQNFLTDREIIKKILDCAEINNKHVLEVGPGTGNLTDAILKKNPKELILVEKDTNLLDLLKERYPKKIRFINEDILDISVSNLSKNKLIVFGNLPYNISTEILTKWILNLDTNLWFDQLILMFQKEVADRIISNSNTANYGRLSIISNWKLNIKKIIDIKPNSFKPRPKIDSTLLVFTPKKDFFKLDHPNSIEKVTRVFFNQKRKKIKKPLNKLFPNSEEIAKKLNLNLDLRPQNLDFETYYKLAKELEKKLRN